MKAHNLSPSIDIIAKRTVNNRPKFTQIQSCSYRKFTLNFNCQHQSILPLKIGYDKLGPLKINDCKIKLGTTNEPSCYHHYMSSILLLLSGHSNGNGFALHGDKTSEKADIKVVSKPQDIKTLIKAAIDD